MIKWRAAMVALFLALAWACSSCRDPDNTRPVPYDSSEGYQNGNVGMMGHSH